MNPNRNIQSIRLATGLLLAGAAAWLVKLAVIAATDGAKAGASDAAAAVFYLAGVALMALGAAALCVWLARNLHLAVRIVAGLLGPIGFFMLMNATDTAAKAVLDDDLGPAWAHDEWGILFTAIIWLTIGLLALQRVRAEAPAPARA